MSPAAPPADAVPNADAAGGLLTVAGVTRGGNADWPTDAVPSEPAAAEPDEVMSDWPDT